MRSVDRNIAGFKNEKHRQVVLQELRNRHPDLHFEASTTFDFQGDFYIVAYAPAALESVLEALGDGFELGWEMHKKLGKTK